MEKNIKELLEFGIINIDKSSGPTSFNVSDLVRKKLNLRKTSHFGTLDPKVTGVLPIALNRACKLTGYFIGHDKEYVGVMRLHKEMDMKKIQKIIDKKFIGKIKQIPPVKSRVKRQERVREVKKFKLIEQNGNDIVFATEVEGGTYIRKLIDDLGKELGIGAHMLELRRTRAGIFKEKKSINLYDFEKALNDEEKLKKIITPAEIISTLYPIIKINKSVDKILHGSPIHHKDLEKKQNIEKGETVVVFYKDQFVGMYTVINSTSIFAKPKFVMQPLKKNELK